MPKAKLSERGANPRQVPPTTLFLLCWVSPNLQAINAENIAKEAKELSLSKIWKEALPKLMRKIH